MYNRGGCIGEDTHNEYHETHTQAKTQHFIPHIEASWSIINTTHTHTNSTMHAGIYNK